VSDQPDLFGGEDPRRKRRREGAREGRRLRDEGMDRADAHANEAWKRQMTIYLREVLAVKPLMTSDDVFELALEAGMTADTHERRAFGSIMKRAAIDGLCVKEDCAGWPSRRPGLHRSPLTVWRSLVVGKARE
jgi:hypothetical protein